MHNLSGQNLISRSHLRLHSSKSRTENMVNSFGKGRRSSSAAFSMNSSAVSFTQDDGPMSTTKALMVSVTVPCFVATCKLDDGDVKIDRVATDQVTVPTVISTNSDMPYEDQLKAADMSEGGSNTQVSFSESAQQPPSSFSSQLTSSSKTGHEDEKKEEYDETPTAEESAHIVVCNNEAGETEINIEALLRLTLKTLLSEWHLLTIPTYTRTDRQLAVIPSTDEDDSNGWLQVQFMVRTTSLAVILERMERIGVGTSVGSLTVYKAELCRTTSAYAQIPVDDDPSLSPPNDGTPTTTPKTKLESTLEGNDDEENESIVVESKRMMQERAIEAAKMEWKNAATRLRIEQVREQINEMAAINFDFMALLVIASILAGVGLITNNTVVIVASMLVSPIMGPVLGLTFGSRIHDWPLVRQSLLNETLACGGCVLVGAFISLCASFTSLASEDWPTNEMQIRGEYMGLLVGIAIAVPSGMGVCLSVLGGNTSSLVGVAISASLLPPAVNAGICFMHSFFLSVGAITFQGHSTEEFARIGIISLSLTVLNIVCIWVSGLVMFEIKEVAPAKQKAAFWAKDIKVARELNKGKEKPAPVDLEIIQDGINAAMELEGKSPSERVILTRGMSTKGLSMRKLSKSKLSKKGMMSRRALKTKKSGDYGMEDAFPMSTSMRDLSSTPVTDRAPGSRLKPFLMKAMSFAKRPPVVSHEPATIENAFPLSPVGSMTENDDGNGTSPPPNGVLGAIGSLLAGIGLMSTHEEDEVVVIEEDSDDDEDEDAHYVDLENMGDLLGFHDDELGIDHSAVASHLGTGRYI